MGLANEKEPALRTAGLPRVAGPSPLAPRVGFLSTGGSVQPLRADETDRDTFQREFLICRNHDWLEVRVFRHQMNAPLDETESLDGYFIANAGYHDLTVASFVRLAHGKQVAFQNACIAHAEATHRQQVIRTVGKQRRVHAHLAGNVFRGKDGMACRHPADERNDELRETACEHGG